MPDIDKRRVPAERLIAMIGERPAGSTYLVPPGGTFPDDAELPASFRDEAAGSDTGAVALWSPETSVLVLPPFPVSQEMAYTAWRVDVLADLIDRPRRIGVLLLRLGGFAVGIFDGRVLVSSKVGARFVKGRHSKGGSSQARFARRRDEQARALFRKACEVLRAQVEACTPPLDHFLMGGDRRTIAAFEKECDYMRRLSDIRLRRILDVGDPKKATLDALPRSLYESVLLRVSVPESGGPGEPRL